MDTDNFRIDGNHSSLLGLQSKVDNEGDEVGKVSGS